MHNQLEIFDKLEACILSNTNDILLHDYIGEP
jgi:hypothetical protein